MIRSHFFPPVLIQLILVLLIICIPASSAVSDPSLNQTIKAADQSGPDYEITEVTMPVQTSWTEPGTYIHPNITIRNAGAADIAAEPLQIQASLGKYQLISKNNQISPFKAGEVRTITPDYLVPSGVPTGEYTLTASVTHGPEQEGESIVSSTVSAPDKLNVKLITSKTKVRSCNCG